MASSIDASTSGAGGVITTADNTGILQLKTAGTTAVTVDASQNVGIGTTSPAFASGTGMQVKGSGDTNIRLSSGSTTGLDLIKISDGTSYLWNRDNASLLFGTNNAERMRIDSSGNLLIGQTTNAQGGRLVVTGSAGTTDDMVFNTNASYCEIQSFNSKPLVLNRQGNPVVINGTSTIAGYKFTMYHTDQSGMAYKYNGTSEQNSCSFQNGNGQVGRIYTSGTATTYSTSSDYRLKENVVPMTGALDKVAQLNPVTFTWKTDGTDGQGFIAHELQAVVPDCVGGTKDAVDADGNPVYQDIDTSFLVATLTAAIKEQQTIINDLKARVTALEGVK